jgi:hypothetical protein
MQIPKKKKSVGVLFQHQKTKIRSPDMTGEIEIQYEDFEQLAKQVRKRGDVARVNVALWFYPADIENGKRAYVSMQLSPPYCPKLQHPDVEQGSALDEFFRELQDESKRDEEPTA